MKNDKNIEKNENIENKDTIKQKKLSKKRNVDKRNITLKTISITSVVLFVTIAILFNIAFESLLGNKLKWDWSQTDLFSVGDVTKEVLNDLDDEIKIIGLYEKGAVPAYNDVELLLEQYENLSEGNIKVDYIDPVKTPSIIRQLDPDELLQLQERTFVVRSDKNDKTKALGLTDLYQVTYDQNYQQQVTGVKAEQVISGAIVYVSSEETPVVYMTKGHGEVDYNVRHSVMVDILRDNNFLVKDLDLLTGSDIPEDAELLIMLSPTSDITVNAKDQIDKYLRKGKSLLILTEFGNTQFSNLNSLLAEYNIAISNDRIREGDRDRRFQEDPYIFLADAPKSFFTQEEVTSLTYVRNVRAINELRNARDWLEVNPIFQTGNQGIIETEGDSENSQTPGVANIGLAAEHFGFTGGTEVINPTKVMVIGSSDFVADDILQVFGTQIYNMYAFYYSMGWLIDIESGNLLISPKELPSYNVTKGTNTSFWVTTILTVIIIPVSLLLAALFVYRKRKNL